MKNNFFIYSVLIIIFISLILIYCFKFISIKKEDFNLLNNSEVLPKNCLYNSNLDPKSNPTLTHINTFRDIPNRFITWTPFTTPIEGQPEFNPYLFNNKLIYPLY
jgi:hypothetical protein